MRESVASALCDERKLETHERWGVFFTLTNEISDQCFLLFLTCTDNRTYENDTGQAVICSFPIRSRFCSCGCQSLLVYWPQQACKFALSVFVLVWYFADCCVSLTGICRPNAGKIFYGNLSVFKLFTEQQRPNCKAKAQTARELLVIPNRSYWVFKSCFARADRIDFCNLHVADLHVMLQAKSRSKKIIFWTTVVKS